MYIHLGADVAVVAQDVVGIFDIEKTSTKKATKEFLRNAQKLGIIEAITDEIPKTYVVVKGKRGTRKIYLSPISAATLNKRQYWKFYNSYTT